MLGDRPKRFSTFTCPVTGEQVKLGQYDDGRTFTQSRIG